MYCPFSEYRDLLGIPGKGVHSIRFINTPIVDYVLTLIAAMCTSLFTKVPLVITTIMWFLLGIILHILFGVQTTTLTYLGIKCNN
jgi:hypothetical protein